MDIMDVKEVSVLNDSRILETVHPFHLVAKFALRPRFLCSRTKIVIRQLSPLISKVNPLCWTSIWFLSSPAPLPRSLTKFLHKHGSAA